jgi:hypothetical protein
MAIRPLIVRPVGASSSTTLTGSELVTAPSFAGYRPVSDRVDPRVLPRSPELRGGIARRRPPVSHPERAV